MAGSPVLSTLDAPWDVLDECAGVALDIGGSVIKITYIDKDDWVEPAKRIKGTKGKIRFASMSREKMNEAFNFIKSHAHFLRKSPNEDIEIFTAGIGGSQLAVDIRKQLNVRTSSLSEFDCFVHAFVHLLKGYTRKEVIHEPYKEAYDNIRKQMEQFQAIVKNMEGTTTMEINHDTTFEHAFHDDPRIRWDKPMGAQDKDVFPCLLTMLGSGYGSMLIKEDGSFTVVDSSNKGGRMFLGQAALMTGVKTYDELMALCEKGDFRGVHTTTVHLSEGIQSDENDMYSAMKDIDEVTVYCFGQAVGKDKGDFKKEDIARGLLHSFALDITQTNHILAHFCQVKHVFFCGSFIQHHLVREEITTEWLRRDISLGGMSPLMKGKQKNCHFLKQGAHLGSLGAFLNSKYHFLKPPPDEAEVQSPSTAGIKQDTSDKAGNASTRAKQVSSPKATATAISTTTATKQRASYNAFTGL